MNWTKTALLLAVMTGLFVAVGGMLGGGTGMVVAFLVAIAMNAFAYWNSDKMVLRMYGAREIDGRQDPELFGLVGELARRAQIPMPKVYVIENEQPNAFATGRNPEHGAVAVTTLLVRRQREFLRDTDIGFEQVRMTPIRGWETGLSTADLAEFIKLQKTFADSPKSWSVDTHALSEVEGFDLSVKNPNGGEPIAHRSPEDIMDEIALLDAESAEVLLSIKGIIGNG